MPQFDDDRARTSAEYAASRTALILALQSAGRMIAADLPGPQVAMRVAEALDNNITALRAVLNAYDTWQTVEAQKDPQPRTLLTGQELDEEGHHPSCRARATGLKARCNCNGPGKGLSRFGRLISVAEESDL